VQLLTETGGPIRILTGVSDAYAETAGDIRIADRDYLANGIIVIVGESRQGTDLVTKYGGTANGNHAIFRIVDPSGNEVKAVSLVADAPVANEIWHGVGVTADGFAVRFAQGGRTKVRMFDNAGNPTTTNLDLGTLTGFPVAAGGGWGDSAGFHGNGNNAYVAVNSDRSAKRVWVTVLNTDGTVRFSRSVADDLTLVSPGTPDAAIDRNGEVIVVFADASATGGLNRLVMGRRFDAAGNPMGGTFYVSELETTYDYTNPVTAPGSPGAPGWSPSFGRARTTSISAPPPPRSLTGCSRRSGRAASSRSD
jgi:hypothetical protein